VLAGSVVDDFVRPAVERERPAVELSEREAEVVRLIARGYTNKEIAAQLKLSVKTIETYKTRSVEKLHIRSRVDIVRHAIKSGWLTDASSDQLAPVPASRGEFRPTSS
jgi:two-component system, NarL family, response regulator NreC